MTIKTTRAALVKAGPSDGLEEGQFTAYASTFTREPDSYGDVVAPGAFEKSLAEWADSGLALPLLFGHRMDDPDFYVGWVLEASEDEHGLLVKCQLDLEGPKGAQVYRLLKGRRINQMSFAFDVVDAGTVEEAGRKVNELRELKLYEVSVVPVGANQETEVLAVKTATGVLVDGVKAGREISADDESELRAAYAALGNVLSSLDQDDDQEKASGTGPANAEEPHGAKAQEPSPTPSARALAELHLTIAAI